MPSISPPTIDPYTLALHRLSLLQSNQSVVSRFSQLPSQSSPNNTQDGKKTQTTKEDLNALSHPETLFWLARSGYTPSSLARVHNLKCVHVAGTKGKGTVSTMVGAILGEYASQLGAGERSRVGLYTSPHVVDVRERIAFFCEGEGDIIPKEEFGAVVNEIWERLTQAAREEVEELKQGKELTPEEEEEIQGPTTKPFFFKFLTLCAFHAFVHPSVAAAVIETGIGGEYDATNILPPECITASVVTQLGIDHVSMLGATLPEIAWHKAGIFKKGVKAFARKLTGEEGEKVMEVLRGRAREKGAQLVEVEDSFIEGWSGLPGTTEGSEGKRSNPFLKQNVALAVHAAREHLLRSGITLPERFASPDWTMASLPEEFIRGLQKAIRAPVLRGRFETYTDSQGKTWFLDGAHTTDSLAGVGRWFASEIGEGYEDEVRVLVFNQQDRDVGGLLRAVYEGAKEGYQGKSRVFTHAVFTRNEEEQSGKEGERDLSVQKKAEETMKALDEGTITEVFDAVKPAVEYIKDLAKQGRACKVLVTGSFHLVGPVLRTINQS
ncbi:putative folylpolyglutamate protein [Thermochaetoides thermophila DSM 1495]|uniref:tetrahydrofolate synthase n=1 Tax=Chaetomium thermophilum (strain DSM 1495 / CBS 144.50 / IMI 039719) TaxID=759272 RepID=G0SHY6_CHATD|nr:putative folylpolyglutamate protein [Thermochaetoides thermophila DSM 1495]EGS17056.1 putative folylpolyglutamate protein [Thermochaetoides thermophila DSM 1495]